MSKYTFLVNENGKVTRCEVETNHINDIFWGKLRSMQERTQATRVEFTPAPHLLFNVALHSGNPVKGLPDNTYVGGISVELVVDPEIAASGAITEFQIWNAEEIRRQLQAEGIAGAL